MRVVFEIKIDKLSPNENESDAWKAVLHYLDKSYPEMFSYSPEGKRLSASDNPTVYVMSLIETGS